MSLRIPSGGQKLIDGVLPVHSDRVFVMDKGRIVESGRYQMSRYVSLLTHPFIRYTPGVDSG